MNKLKLNWDYFCECYKLKDEKYIDDVDIISKLSEEQSYPKLFFPLSIKNQTAKCFSIGSFLVKGQEDKCIRLHDFLEIAKKLELPGNWEFLIHPYEPTAPQKRKIPYQYTKKYTSHNYGCIIPIVILFLLLGTIPAICMDVGSDFVIIITLLWIPAALLFANKAGVGKSETKYKTILHTEQELENMTREANIEYNNALTKFKVEIEEYNDKLKECNCKQQQQSSLLDFYSNLIVEDIWKSNCIGKNILAYDDALPQRGRAENLLFYELMKTYPQYVKIDLKVVSYYPDIIININNCYFIDVEIDEPYDYKTKKEIHYVGSNDNTRNQFFVENNWFVMRFTEYQIVNELSYCLSIVENMIDFIKTGNTNHLSKIEDIKSKISQSAWTKEEARVMAIENYRDNYWS